MIRNKKGKKELLYNILLGQSITNDLWYLAAKTLETSKFQPKQTFFDFIQISLTLCRVHRSFS